VEREIGKARTHMKLEWAAVIGLVVLADAAAAGEDPALTEQQKASYGVGVSMARSLGRQGAELDADLVARGLRDALSGKKLLVSEAEMRAAASAHRAEQNRRSAGAETPAEAKEKGEAFLAENGRKEGVVTLGSGLQYQVLKAGQGQIPRDGDRVVCHYRGTFIDGTEFDSSYQRGRPATLDLRRVIPGWREALKLMPVGSKWKLFVPSKLAYGERGMRGGRRKRPRGGIGPNRALVFEVELLAVRGPPPPDPGPKRAAAAARPVSTEN
jgi:FKBP-type peptidyl-prolyl cis-trans isomerase FklB